MRRGFVLLLAGLTFASSARPALAQESTAQGVESTPHRDRELRFGAWVLGGTFAGPYAWQGTVLAGGGLEVAFGNRVRLRAEAVGGWEGSSGTAGLAAPANDVGRAGLRLGVGIAASHLFELRTFGGLGMWLGDPGGGLQVDGNWELGQRLVFHFPPDNHLEIGAELTLHGSFSGNTNPFGGGVFVGFVL